MNRRRALALVAGALLARPAWPRERLRRIGILTLADPATGPAGPGLWRALEEGLRELGHREGQNLAIERRHAAGMVANLPQAASELGARQVELILAVGAQVVRAVQRALPQMPVVALLGDPVGGGFAKTLARPGGMVTGVTNIGADISVKQIELLRAAVPRLASVAILGNSSNPFTKSVAGSLQHAAAQLGVGAKLFDAANPEGVEAAIGALAREKPGAVVVVQDILLVQQGKRIAELLLKHRIPSAGGGAEQAALGLMMSYGANLPEAFRRMASYVDRLLRGAKPGELPMEILERYELVLNLKTAKALGLAIPQDLLLRCDRVIE